jgi:acyl dehydratase
VRASEKKEAATVRRPAEDLPVGGTIPLGEHAVSEEEIVEFAAVWDPQYFHVDRAAAAEGRFGGLIASGLHTASIFQRLCVAGIFSDYDVIAGKEIHNLRFLRAVRPGDVLTGSVLVRSVEPDGRGRALVVLLGTLRNQDGQPVLELELDSLVGSRAPTTRVIP